VYLIHLPNISFLRTGIDECGSTRACTTTKNDRWVVHIVEFRPELDYVNPLPVPEGASRSRVQE